MKYTKKVWIPALIIVLLVIVAVGFAFINSIYKPDRVLANESSKIHKSVVKADNNGNNITKAPDMDGIETDAMLKDINEHGGIANLDSIKTSSTIDDDVIKTTEKKPVEKDDIDDFVKLSGVDNNDSDTSKKPDKAFNRNKSGNDFANDMSVGIEKGADFDVQPMIKKQTVINLTETYKTPYFTVKFPAAEWEYAEGKSMDLPSFVDIPRKTAVATVEFLNKKNGNSIFLHISHSGGADLNKMTPAETRNYLRYIYNDARIEKVPIEFINNMRFAVLKFVPRNNKLYLVKQYLTTKSNYLYCITFIEKKTSEINQKMINEVLGSMLVK